MGNWTGWVAALGGLISIVSKYAASLDGLYGVEIGGAIAIIFGIWAAMK